MVIRIQKTLSGNRKRILPGLVALALLAGLIVSLVGTPSAQADYNVGGCGYGYSSNGSSFGSGSPFGYGYVNGQYVYGYGYQACGPLSITTSSLNGGTVGSAYSQTLTGTGGVGPYFWSESGPFDGLTLASDGTISGTPNAGGNYPITVTMTDENHVGTTADLTLSVTTSTGGGGGGGSGGSTTTSPTSTTTTTGPTTTTTPPPVRKKRFFASKVTGFAIPGRSELLTVLGAGFYGNPNITSNEAGTRVGTVHDRGTSLVIRVIVKAGSRTGEHTLTIRFADGQTCKANYSVK
jgi:hypothetical protein